MLGRWVVRLAAACGALYLVATLTPVTRWWTEALAREWYPAKGDVLVILAADAADRETIGGQSYWRAVYGVWAWRQGGFRRVIVSGGGDPPPAVPLRQFLVAHGVPAEAVDAETASTSTKENAERVAELLRGETGRVILLTSDYHSWRAVRVFRRAGLTVWPSPAPDALKGAGNWRYRWPVFLQLAEETAKIAVYAWKGAL